MPTGNGLRLSSGCHDDHSGGYKGSGPCPGVLDQAISTPLCLKSIATCCQSQMTVCCGCAELHYTCLQHAGQEWVHPYNL